MDKLEMIREELNKLYGHLACAEEERGLLISQGRKDGYEAGYKRGREAGFDEGFKEGKIFPNVPKVEESTWAGA